ncbi:hypothetical protein BDV95DRAFT_193868 [Massariosphaeria phaeospora]|uniref:Uncharacterized protein n=1 Tax=Massariosphaeria phaeospora TaxID=100035 RepID=A0A7C8M3F3_9PLEO|nr:hypothetical protein BDV95DRAFT_193868 [Massariosphaeria phaeospora]
MAPAKKAASQPTPQPDEPPPAPSLPDEERLKQAAASAQAALDANSKAQSLKDAAASMTDPKKRDKLLRDAYTKEIEAHGSSKKARMLQSGAFQGGAGGAGIGGAVGLGVGTVVGTVVGGLTAIPTTALGGLVGSGVGAFHGPFIKLPPLPGMGKGKEGDKKAGEGGKGDKGKKGDDKDGKSGKEGGGEDPEDDENAVPDPAALRKAADAVAEERTKQQKRGGPERKKPRKLEVRSGKQSGEAK